MYRPAGDSVESLTPRRLNAKVTTLNLPPKEPAGGMFLQVGVLSSFQELWRLVLDLCVGVPYIGVK